MHDLQKMGIDTICIHSGHKSNPEGAVVTPIYQTSTFKFENADHGARLFKGEEEGYIYTRMRNPTVEAMEDAVAALEGGYKALGCASGMAAVHTLFTAVVEKGDHIVCCNAAYGPTIVLLREIFSKYGVETTFVDTSDLVAVKNAMRNNTKLVFVETPGNPTLVISDIEEICKIAKSYNAKVAVDNTFMSPIYQRPFELGVDYIIHSMTKFLNGHADVVAGIIIAKDKQAYTQFRKTLNMLGGVIDPFNSFLVHRGLRTLAMRVRYQAENAMKIAEFLENHPKVDKVFYPGLPSHPQFEIAKKQMSGSGSMIAIELKGGFDAGKKLMDNIELFALAVSLGGVESLIQHPASMTHAGMGREARLEGNITDGLVRLAIGCENYEDILNSLKNGLDKI